MLPEPYELLEPYELPEPLELLEPYELEPFELPILYEEVSYDQSVGGSSLEFEREEEFELLELEL